MKKIFLSILMFFILITNIEAKTITVKFNDCVDGDTAKFTYKDEVITARFLAVDTPETKHPTKGEEPYGKEASEFTCNALKEANEIKLEFDDNSDEKDKYDRYLVWVFVDDKLLQEDLISNGLAKVAYLYDDYKYTPQLQKLEKTAKKNKIGIWYNNKQWYDYFDEYKEIIILIGIVIIFCIFSAKARKNVKKDIERDVNREFRNYKSKLKKDIKNKLK